MTSNQSKMMSHFETKLAIWLLSGCILCGCMADGGAEIYLKGRFVDSNSVPMSGVHHTVALMDRVELEGDSTNVPGNSINITDSTGSYYAEDFHICSPDIDIFYYDVSLVFKCPNGKWKVDFYPQVPGGEALVIMPDVKYDSLCK
ncbi:MAG: hypothetical protein IPK50_01405 [Fibrobacterota bacterium]|nr:MAG: hypothetical protein IPK50_01405 [Fibrobacterota bacterium]